MAEDSYSPEAQVEDQTNFKASKYQYSQETPNEQKYLEADPESIISPFAEIAHEWAPKDQQALMVPAEKKEAEIVDDQAANPFQGVAYHVFEEPQ